MEDSEQHNAKSQPCSLSSKPYVGEEVRWQGGTGERSLAKGPLFAG